MTRELALLALLVACKGDKPGSGSATVTDDEGRAVLAITFEYVEALCKCTDRKCLEPVLEKYRGNPRIGAQVGTSFHLSPDDETGLLDLEQRRMMCFSRASGIVEELGKITEDAIAKAEDEALLAAAIPATTPRAKAYLPKLRDVTKAACKCKNSDCYKALVEPTRPEEDLAVAEMAYAVKLRILYAECGIRMGIAPAL